MQHSDNSALRDISGLRGGGRRGPNPRDGSRLQKAGLEAPEGSGQQAQAVEPTEGAKDFARRHGPTPESNAAPSDRPLSKLRDAEQRIELAAQPDITDAIGPEEEVETFSPAVSSALAARPQNLRRPFHLRRQARLDE